MPYRVHLPDGVRDCRSIDEGVAYAEEAVPEMLRAQAEEAGAHDVEVHLERVDRKAPVRLQVGEEVYVETELTFTAVGRPSPARSANS